MIPDNKYVSQDDASEAKRLKDLNDEEIPVFLTDEQVRQYSLSDFGLTDDLSR